jgi:uncharacterized protein
MKYFYLILLFTITSCSSVAQTVTGNQSSVNTIVIDAQGEDLAPADEVYFNINLTRFHQNAETAFEEHKKLERYLTNLLLERGFKEEDISAEPVSISQRRYSNEQGFETRQRVSIKLDDIVKFERMQVDLIKNGFDNFSGNFGSSKMDESRDKALQNAVQEAQRKASLLATASGKRVGSVKSIEYSTSTPFMTRDVSRMAMESSDGGLIQFQTTIPVRESVRITFFLSD